MPRRASTVAAPPAPTVRITFTVPAELGARHAELIGEFVGWTSLPMDRDPTGRFSVEIFVQPGRRWRYRFLLDGTTLMNDPAATEFASDANGDYVSVIRT